MRRTDLPLIKATKVRGKNKELSNRFQKKKKQKKKKKQPLRQLRTWQQEVVLNKTGQIDIVCCNWFVALLIIVNLKYIYFYSNMEWHTKGQENKIVTNNIIDSRCQRMLKPFLQTCTLKKTRRRKVITFLLAAFALMYMNVRACI